MKKPSPKRQIQLFHKLAMLSFLMQDTIDELNPDLAEYCELQEMTGKMGIKCEEIISNVFAIDSLKKSTYIQDLTSKMDSVIRNNFKMIPD